ncbi:MAG: type I glutamate--ammonia ligase [Myxococcales bacterium]|nr:type I glutamate--ammonia ligase [Myxococcales bacterium]
MPPSTLTPRDVFRTIKEKDIRYVDLKYVDLFGRMLHLSLPVGVFDEDLFINGLNFDGSSVRGFQSIHDSDMIMKPDINTMFIDPFMDDPTLSFFCNIINPRTQDLYTRDTRALAARAERYVRQSRLADTAFFGPELEFYVFDDVRFHQDTRQGFYHIDSKAGFWNMGRDEGPNIAYKVGQKRGYSASLPIDTFHNLRAKMCNVLMAVGIDVELHHGEVGSGGQNEIGMRFSTLTDMADRAIKYKYVIKNVAHRYGKTATFMPKPLFQEAGSGMHVNMSLWKDNKNLFYASGRYGEISETAEYFIGGVLEHAPAISAFCNPTTNSYRRLVPGYEAPINRAYSASNRSVSVRIPMGASSPKAKRIEYRTPDPSSNPYLAFAAILMAGLDGIERKLKPPAPIDDDIYEMDPKELEDLGILGIPADLAEALQALRQDHEFLLRGGVFTPDLIETWLRMKQKDEVDYVRLRPHPGEFSLYFDT